MNGKTIKKIIEPKDITWKEFIELHYTKRNNEFIYRGDLFNYDLQPSLEKACINWGINNFDNLPAIEEQLLRDFKRCFPEDNSINEIQNNTLECMALMQHWGGPTRLLDFTYSPFVACYFATKYAIKKFNKNNKQNQPTIWEINIELLKENLKPPFIDKKIYELIKKFNIERKNEDFEELYLNRKEKFIYTANPFRQNSRMIAQKGLFMLACDISVSFEENLKVIPNFKQFIKRYVLQSKNLSDVIYGLDSMNINEFSLFPGLDGFSRSYFYRRRFYK